MLAPDRSIRRILGVCIHGLTMDEVLAAVDDAIEHRRRLLISVVNAAKIVNMRQDQLLRRSVLAADLVLADGMSVVWASRVLGQRLPERIAGIDLMMRMLGRSDVRGYRVFCLGATDDVLNSVARQIKADYPNVNLVGTHNGYYDEHDEADVAARIAEAGPDILLVGISSPKKERFLAHWADRLGVPVCHGVGGAFDVMAGKVKRAPALWQRLGIEWLYRVFQEPRRMWRRYLVTNTIFGFMLLNEALARLRLGRTWQT